MDHREWVKQATGDSLRGVARKLGINEGNFPGQARKGLTADRVIEIARAYHVNIVKALVDTGHISIGEAPEVIDEKLGKMIDTLVRLREQSQYGLAADSSPEEGDGNPDDYLP